MKSLISLIAVSLIAVAAQAEQTLLSCTIHAKTSRDTQKVVIADTSNGLVKKEITRNGKTTTSAITEKQWSSRNIRLSNDSNGFRYLTYTYSQIFQETGWFVMARGPGYQSEGRANCR